jgi:hypothetical protein
VKAKSCAGSSEAGAGTSPFPGPRMSLAAAGVNLQVFGFSHFFAGAKFRFRRSFANHVTEPTDWTAGKVLDPAHFRGPIPFPPSPRFWDSWTDNWLETNLSAYDANVGRGSSSFEPL